MPNLESGYSVASQSKTGIFCLSRRKNKALWKLLVVQSPFVVDGHRHRRFRMAPQPWTCQLEVGLALRSGWKQYKLIKPCCLNFGPSSGQSVPRASLPEIARRQTPLPGGMLTDSGRYPRSLRNCPQRIGSMPGNFGRPTIRRASTDEK